MRVLALLLVVLMFSALMAACAGETETTQNEAAEVTGETQVADEPQATEAVEEPAATEAVAETEETTADAEKYGGTMRLSMSADLQRPNFLLTSDGPAGMVRDICWEKLYGVAWDGSLVPRLATSYEKSEDSLTYTVHLREDVLWQDGEPMTADDVVFYHEFYKLIESVDKYEPPYPFTVAKIDDYTVQFTLETPDPFFAYQFLADYKIWPEHIWKDVDPAQFDNISDPSMFIGVGPFKFVEYQVGEYIRFERFDDYWDGKPYLDEVVIQIIPDADARAVAFETGQLDYSGINKTLFETLKDDPGFTIVERPSGNMSVVLVNHKDERLAELEVRQALSYLVDRESMVIANTSFAQPMDSCITSADVYYDPSAADPEAFVYDVDKAIAVLEEAGWMPGSDGIREKDGKRLEFELISWRSDAEQLGVMFQQSCEAAGIAITFKTIDLPLFIQRVFTEGEESYELAFNGMTMGPTPDGYRNMYTVGTYTTYVSEATQEIYEQMYLAPDEAGIQEAMSQLQRQVTEDRALLWAFESSSMIATANGLNMEDCGLSGLYQRWISLSKAYFEK